MDGVTAIKTELYAPYHTRPIFPANKVLAEGPLTGRTDPKMAWWDAEERENQRKLMSLYSERRAQATASFPKAASWSATYPRPNCCKVSRRGRPVSLSQPRLE